MRIADNPFDAVETRQLLGRALRIAAGDQDASAAIRRVNVADGIARLRVRRGCDGTRVQHDDFGVAMAARAQQSPIEQLPLDRRSIRVRGSTPKIFDVESRQNRFTAKFKQSRNDYSSAPKTKGRLNHDGPAGQLDSKFAVYEDPCGFSIFFCLIAFTLSTRSSAIFSSAS